MAISALVADVRLVAPFVKDATAYPDATIDTFIALANNVVEVHMSLSGYSAATLKNIETYLTAHYLSVSYENGGLSSDKMGDSAETYRDLAKSTAGLGQTLYGQQALALDIGGYLGSLASGPLKASFRIV